MRFLLFILICFGSNSCINADSSEQMSDSDIVNFDNTILLIHQKVADLPVADMLFSVDEFVYLWEHPTLYADSVIAFISNDSYSQTAKIIAIYSLQKLPIKSYTNFLEKAIDLFEDGKISETIIKNALFAPIGKNTVMEGNYYRISVQKLLKRVLNNDRISAVFKEDLQHNIYWYAYFFNSLK